MFFDYMLLEENPYKVAPKKRIKAVKAKIIDNYELSLSNLVCEEMTDAEIQANVGSALLFDVESYINYGLLLMRQPELGKVISFEDDEQRRFDIPKMRWVLEHYCNIGFNSRDYDMPIICLALAGKRAPFLNKVTKEIIEGVNGQKLTAYDIYKRYKIDFPKFDHIDLISVCPLQGSLKLYAGRLHSKRMQSLPIEPDARLTAENKVLIKSYCNNDLYSTDTVFEELKPHLVLRIQMSKQYGVDVRSKSDAQIAESVIVAELAKHGVKAQKVELSKGTSYFYKVPSFIKYQNPVLNQMLEIVKTANFVLDANGYVNLPPELEGYAITIGLCTYRMGIGGLHSSEKSIAHIADDKTLLIDRDVASYYPAIILNERLYPKHLGEKFLDVYGSIRQRRLEAKKAKDDVTAGALKITINGSFGKFGNKWSVLYSPDLMLQVTLTGQLALLMLIDMAESIGIPVVSGNTDGVIFKCPKSRYEDLQKVIAKWEQATGYETEETRYKAIYSRDVNNYIAITEEGKTKVKGVYSYKGSALNSPLSKNPENAICNDAVIALLSKNKPVEETIRECQDIRRFLSIRNVKGGAIKSGVLLGKCVRWYYSTLCKGEISYNGSGNKVAKTEGAMPLMELPDEIPPDIDYDKYISITNEILHDIAYIKAMPSRIVKEVFDFS